MQGGAATPKEDTAGPGRKERDADWEPEWSKKYKRQTAEREKQIEAELDDEEEPAAAAADEAAPRKRPTPGIPEWSKKHFLDHDQDKAPRPEAKKKVPRSLQDMSASRPKADLPPKAGTAEAIAAEAASTVVVKKKPPRSLSQMTANRPKPEPEPVVVEAPKPEPMKKKSPRSLSQMTANRPKPKPEPEPVVVEAPKPEPVKKKPARSLSQMTASKKKPEPAKVEPVKVEPKPQKVYVPPPKVTAPPPPKPAPPPPPKPAPPPAPSPPPTLRQHEASNYENEEVLVIEMPAPVVVQEPPVQSMVKPVWQPIVPPSGAYPPKYWRTPVEAVQCCPVLLRNGGPSSPTLHAHLLEDVPKHEIQVFPYPAQEGDTTSSIKAEEQSQYLHSLEEVLVDKYIKATASVTRCAKLLDGMAEVRDASPTNQRRSLPILNSSSAFPHGYR